jgi:hypothetical protein
MTVQERAGLRVGENLMTQYYIDKTPESSGERLVHRGGCRHCPRSAIYLGSFASRREALVKARRYYICVAGCKRCCGEL